tara:strand:+ start:70 stop:219 length:150 start_codon:yes stop_codon:yes gene_type:complete
MTSPFIKGLMTEEELDSIVGITTSVVSDDYDKDPDGQIFDDYTDPYGGH